MSEKIAAKTIAGVDKARESYHRRYIPGYQNAVMESDLCINSGIYDVKKAAELIREAAGIRFGF